VIVGLSAFGLHYLSPSLFRAQSGPSFEQAELSRDRLVTLNQILAAAPDPARPVYQYSLVPGGVQDVKELKWVAEHDPVVGAHYAGFDYDHARVVRLTLARTAYVSYRIGNHVYWTRHRLTLHKGEKVITDGKMTARARCANRVEELPRQAAAPLEPPAVAFDQPIPMPAGTGTQSPPVPFQSAMLNRPTLGGSGFLSMYDPIGGGSWVPISPPPLPSGLCSPGKKPVETGGGKKKKKPCGGPVGVVPEPETWIMLISGLAFIAIYWQAERRMAPEAEPLS
jgi:hypothetical protein